MLRNKNPNNNLRTLTARDPTLFPADSNESEVIVQKKAVSSAANSPIWDSIKLILKSFLIFNPVYYGSVKLILFAFYFMDALFKLHFINQWKKYFNNTELPIAFYYSDKPENVTIMQPGNKRQCLICQLKKVFSGESLAFSKESLNCSGAKRYLGFSESIRPNFEYFLSCGIENEMEGERYKRTPEIVREMMRNQKKICISGKYIVFKRWDNLDENDNPEVVIFFVTPDILSGLFTLSGFDQADNNSTIAPFGAGCGSIVHYPYLEKGSDNPRAVIGMFDVSARPCVKPGILSFSVPVEKFVNMVNYMDESFLITESWREVQRRIP
jgi:hypothetical protein